MELTLSGLVQRAGTTQHHLAKRSGVAQARISRLLAGRAVLREEDVQKLSPVLKCSEDELRVIAHIQRLTHDIASGNLEPSALRAACKSVSDDAGADLDEGNRDLLVALASLAEAGEVVSKETSRMTRLGRDSTGRRLRGRAAKKAEDERTLLEGDQYGPDERNAYLGRDSTGRRRPERERPR